MGRRERRGVEELTDGLERFGDRAIHDLREHAMA
jgi:hypothetical protein